MSSDILFEDEPLTSEADKAERRRHARVLDACGIFEDKYFEKMSGGGLKHKQRRGGKKMSKKTVEIAHDGAKRETARAKLYDFGDSEEWIANSLIEDETDNTITIPEWLAKDKGLI